MKLLISLLLALPLIFTTPIAEENISAVYGIEDLESLAEKGDKKIIVKLSASWCKPCKQLSKTMKDPAVESLIKNDFYLVEFDVQSKQNIKYKNQAYTYVDNDKMPYHQLAYEMLDKRLSFPALLVLDSDLNKIDLTRGSKTKEQLLAYLSEI